MARFFQQGFIGLHTVLLLQIAWKKKNMQFSLSTYSNVKKSQIRTVEANVISQFWFDWLIVVKWQSSIFLSYDGSQYIMGNENESTRIKLVFVHHIGGTHVVTPSRMNFMWWYKDAPSTAYGDQVPSNNGNRRIPRLRIGLNLHLMRLWDKRHIP